MNRCVSTLIPAAAAAFLGFSPVQAQTDDAAGRVPKPLREALSSASSRAGGETPAKVPGAAANRRRFTFQGSPTVLTVWDEPTGDARTTGFALSLDGRHIDQVASTTNIIRMDYARFDPLAGEPGVPGLLSANAENELYLVQFVATPLEEMRREITQMGGTVERFMTDNTHIIRLSAAARAQVAALPYVRWVGAYHPAYRVPTDIMATLLAGETPDTLAERYSIECMRRGPGQQTAIATLVTAIGGIVDTTIPDQYRLEATLTPAQLLQIVQRNEVSYVDHSGAPYGQDMDICRQVGGAVPLLSGLGFRGQGVRGEVFDFSIQPAHEQWAGQAPLVRTTNAGNDSHGTACYGVNFATGTPVAQAQATGMLPNREQGIISSYIDTNQAGLGTGTITRLSLNTGAVNPAGAFRSCYQSSSVGSPRVLTYTTVSAEVDDYLFLVDYLSFQSQSNAAGTRDSRPQAWAKNIVSIGGIDLHETVTHNDDTFDNDASIGPADDLRVKPDLSHANVNVYTTWSSAINGYGQFNGTSSATPITAGHGGLLSQMWHEGVWAGFGGGSTVFSDRPKSTTAKAILINSAYRYPLNAPIANNMYRSKIGWGIADLAKAYNDRASTFIINESDLITNGQTRTYQRVVAPGTAEFRATMIFADPAGSVAAAQDRINDLTLKVTAPDNTVYWGNNGMVATATAGAGALVHSNVTLPGGAANTVDTVENVFLNNPLAGTWTIQVIGSQIVQDSHTETPALDADFALVVAGTSPLPAGPAGPFAYSVQSNGDDHLYRIDLGSGAATDLGLVGNGDLEGLSFGPNGNLYGITGSASATTGQVWDISIPPGSQVGGSFARAGLDGGLDYFNGTMYNLQGASATSSSLYSINMTTGAPTLIGAGAFFGDNLAIDGLGNAYAADLIFNFSLYSVNLANGAMTLVGPLGVSPGAQAGMSFSSDGTLWLVTSGGQIYTINTATGAATSQGNVTVGGANTGSWEGMAIDKLSALAKMDIPAFGSTFSSATLTRGLYFTAPYNGSIMGVRVPDEAGAGIQNVEIVRFTAGAPPAFPTVTNSFVSLGRFTNVAGTNIIPCDIPVGAGDIIGLLGACGTTTMNSSYSTASGAYASSMKGLPVSIGRLGMQHNLFTQAAADLFTEPTGTISRVEVYYTDGRQNLYLDADQTASGGNLVAAPLSNVLGSTTFVNGELLVNGGGDPEFIAAGSRGFCFDGLNAPNAVCDLNFNYDVDCVTFLYGGNSGGITIEAYNAAGTLVDSFAQASTFGGEPAGPRSLAGTGIRRLHWFENVSGSFAGLDNVRIHASNSCYANCDGSTTPPVLNVLDFSCFLNRFAAGDGYANCDGSTTPPVLNVLDFSCYLNRFAAGCN